MLWEKLSLSGKEGNHYKSGTKEQFGGKVFAAKFFIHRVLNMEAIARMFKPLWRTKKGFEVKDMGNRIVLFMFAEEFDIGKVLTGESWSCDKHPVLI